MPASRTARLRRLWSRHWSRHWTFLRSQRSRRVFLQLVKASLAAVVAWVVSGRLFDLPVATLAPWAALLTAQATVYRSVRSGAEQTVATVAGVLLAFGGVHVLGHSPLTLGVLLLAGLLLGRIRFFTEQQTTIAVSALFVMTLGYVDQQRLLAARIGDVAVGVLAGVVVNLVFVPPLASGDAAQPIAEGRQRIADALRAIASGLREGWDAQQAGGWFREAIRIDEELGDIWSTLTFARESTWWNPRRRFVKTASYRALRNELIAVEQVGAELRSMVRVLWADASDRTERDEDRGHERETDGAGDERSGRPSTDGRSSAGSQRSAGAGGGPPGGGTTGGGTTGGGTTGGERSEGRGQGVGALARDLAYGLELLASIAEGRGPGSAAVRAELDELLASIGERPGVERLPAAVSVLAGIRSSAAELSGEASRSPEHDGPS